VTGGTRPSMRTAGVGRPRPEEGPGSDWAPGLVARPVLPGGAARSVLSMRTPLFKRRRDPRQILILERGREPPIAGRPGFVLRCCSGLIDSVGFSDSGRCIAGRSPNCSISRSMRSTSRPIQAHTASRRSAPVERDGQGDDLANALRVDSKLRFGVVALRSSSEDGERQRLPGRGSQN
jgi:hypothetical protein